MARQCTQCGKSSQMQTKRKLLRGNYNPTNRTRKYPNIQWGVNAQGIKAKMCTQCIRTAEKH